MYEVIAILNPNTTSDVLESKISDWTKVIQDFSGTLHRIERWGKKNLAYEVKKFHQGLFVLFHIEGKHDVITELERRFRIADEVIRYQSVKLSDVEHKASVEFLDGLKTRFDETDHPRHSEKRDRFSDEFTDSSGEDDSDDRYNDAREEEDEASKADRGE